MRFVLVSDDKLELLQCYVVCERRPGTFTSFINLGLGLVLPQANTTESGSPTVDVTELQVISTARPISCNDPLTIREQVLWMYARMASSFLRASVLGSCASRILYWPL